MAALFYALAFAVVAVLVYLARYSGRVRAEAVRLIDAPLPIVRGEVEDLRRWHDWNPWLAHESDVPVTLWPPGDRPSRASWQGRQVGAGRVELRSPRAGGDLEQRLVLELPFGFRGRARWRFAERDGKTETRWQIRGRVGLASRFFAPTARGAIALDLRHGLERLAARIEPPTAPRQILSVLGECEQPTMQLACIDHHGAIGTLAQGLSDGVATLRAQLRERGLDPAGAPVVIYQGTNLRQGTTRCWIGLPVPAAAIDGLTVRERPAHRAFVVRLDGTREGLDLAWYQAMQRLRIEGLELDQRVAPFERWTADGVIELCLPLRQHAT